MNPSERNLLYNREGLPASPFRTDDWPSFDTKAEIVEVLKPEKAEVNCAKQATKSLHDLLAVEVTP